MPEVRPDVRYNQDHLWVRPLDQPGMVRIGISDFAQDSLGDVVNVDPPAIGASIRAGEPCGEIESVKSISDLVAPVAGTVRGRNDVLAARPELVNTDPYGEGWIFEVETDPATLGQQLAALLDAAAYQSLTAE